MSASAPSPPGTILSRKSSWWWTARGKAVGATLGNDVNLRDYEGRSALLLGKAKDNNAASALGPFIRMFDDEYTMDDVRNAVVELEIVGADNYRLEGKSTMAEISRDPLDLVKQTISEHQYPDGFALFLGTLFAPTQDRDVRGSGFTHKEGDVVQDFHAQTGCAGKPGHHLQGGAALELRHFRSDEKPCTAWASCDEPDLRP